jgi:hypothetical protein
MEVKEIQNKKAEVVVDVICDCCGNSCKKDEGVIDSELPSTLKGRGFG